MLTDLYPQFLTIATLHLFAVMSPGPDFALIIRQSLYYNRRASIITSIGIGTGILFHIFYCIIGLGIIISQSSYLFNLFRICGGLYLIFIGYKSFSKKLDINMKSDIPINISSNMNSSLVPSLVK